MTEREPNDLVDQALADANRPEPPADLTDAVMRRVTDVEAGLSGWRRWRRARRSRRITNFLSRARVDKDRQSAFQGGVIVRTKILWGVTGLAAMAIVSFFVFGYPPVDRSGTEATINQAQRYQGATLSAKDVSVPDTDVQQFIQSDTFDRLLKDKEAREALLAMFKDADAALALAHPAVRDLAVRPGALEALAKPSVQALFANAGVRAVLAEPAVAALLPSLRPQLEDAAFMSALTMPGVEEALALPAIQRSLAQGNLAALRQDQAMAAFVSQPAVANALQNAQVRVALASPALAKLLAIPAMKTALADQAAANILAAPNLAAVMADANVSMVLAKPGVAEALTQPAIKAGLANVALMNAMSLPAMGKALAVPANHAAIAAGLKINQ